MCLRFLQVAWRYHTSGEVPHQGHGEYPGESAVAEPAQ
jgi:hypothetical protein